MGQIGNWDTDVLTLPLPQFQIGPNWCLGHRYPNLTIVPIWNWVKLVFGTPVFQHYHCPNFKLDQIGIWDTSVPTWPLSQFQIEPNWNLGHRYPNLTIVPISNWAKLEFGTPVFQLDHCPNFKLGQIGVWDTGVPTWPLSQFQIGPNWYLGHFYSNITIVLIWNWTNSLKFLI